MIQVRKELKGWIIKLKIIRQLLCGIFLSNQYKEIEENNTMGKTRNLFKKIRDTKGTFHAKMGLMKHKLESRLTGGILITSDMQMTPPLCHKVKRN